MHQYKGIDWLIGQYYMPSYLIIIPLEAHIKQNQSLQELMQLVLFYLSSSV